MPPCLLLLLLRVRMMMMMRRIGGENSRLNVAVAGGSGGLETRDFVWICNFFRVLFDTGLELATTAAAAAVVLVVVPLCSCKGRHERGPETR